MNIRLQGNAFGQGSSFGLMTQGLKSTQQKLERQNERDNKIAFFENQIENLKDRECDSLEEIQEKLEMFHSYEDQIAAAKHEYNNSQMFHAMDEAMERAEKIAEAVEKSAPKTPEERREEMLEEALGIDESKNGMLEGLEEAAELPEELAEEMEELAELEEESGEGVENLTGLTEGVQEGMDDIAELAEGHIAEMDEISTMAQEETEDVALEEARWKAYKRIDFRI